MSTKHHRAILIAAIAVLVPSSTNGGILYSENFDSGNAARTVWQESPSAANFDASSGDYVLSQPDGDTPVLSFITGDPAVSSLSDTSVRAQVGLDGSSVGVGLFARGGGTSYQGGFNPDSKRLYLGWNNPGFNLFDRVNFDYDLNAEDLVLQLDVIGNELSLRAWRPGDDMPDQPQLTFIDDGFLASSGSPGILNDGGSPGAPSTATFRYVQVANSPIPEPSACLMCASAVLSLFFVRRQLVRSRR